MQLTGIRAEQYATLVIARRMRAITKETYDKEKARLAKLQAGVEKRAAQFAAKREAKKAERAAAVAARRQAKKAERAAKKQALAQADNMNDDTDLHELWKQIRGQEVRLMIFDRNTKQSHADTIFAIPDTYKEFRRTLLTTVLGQDYDADIADTILASSRVVALQPSQLVGKRLIQKFRDGVVHCVFSVIVDELQKRLENSSGPTAKRYAQRIAQQRKFEEQYAMGVPEEEMEMVARACGFKIEVCDALGQNATVYNSAGRFGVIRFSNTRTNHVERGTVVRSNPVEVCEDELQGMFWEAKQRKRHFEVQGDLTTGKIRRLNMLTGSYVLADPEQKIHKQFDDELKIDMFRINANANPDLNEFLKAGRIVNSWSCSLGGKGETACADLSRAYTRFRDAPFFNGFLGKVHQFRSGAFDLAFMERHIGFYRITIHNEPSDLLQMLGLVKGLTCVMFSQEALYYASMGVEMTADMGAWGSRFEFDFPDYMLENRRYCTWAGRLGMDRSTTALTIPAESVFADHLKSLGHDVLYWKQDGLATIKQPNKHRWTAHHILGAITAYTRINMVQAMQQFKPEQLCRVVMDGIYFKGPMPELANFTVKKVKRAMSEMTWFDNSGLKVSAPAMPEMPIYRDTLLMGQGGSGKTFSILTDAGYVQPLVVVPNNQLGMDHHTKYGVPFTTIHKLIGIECQPYHSERGHPAVCLIDELTQIDGAWIDAARSMYPHTLFLIAGDMDAAGRWYQCRGGDGKEYTAMWKPSNCDFLEYVVDRRSRDDDLRALKLRVREEMRRVFDEEERDFLMRQWAIDNMQFEDCIDFQPGDSIIAGTHRTNKKLLEQGIVSGYYKAGGYVSREPLPGYEQRGSFTIHSYQGKTIEEGRVWIVVDDLFEYAMLYTAVSRAVHASQLRFVRRV